MTEQSLNQEFDFYYNKLSIVQKESILFMMKSFIEEIENTKRISVTQYNSEIEAAEKRIDNGQFVSQESLRKESEKW